MSNEQQHTPAELVAMHMFGIIYSVLQSPATPINTKGAILQTLEHILNDDKGPFQTDEDMNMMGEAFATAINKIVTQLKGQEILDSVLSRPETLN